MYPINKQITFYVMSCRGYHFLERMIEAFGAQIVHAVVSSLDSGVKQDCYTSIEAVCSEHGIPFFSRQSAGPIETDYAFAVGWRWMIETEKRLIIFHDSLLPRYRGFAPLVASLINQEPEIGVTALFASNAYDCGDIIAQRSLTVSYPIRIAEAIERITPLYCELGLELIEKIIKDQPITGTKQNKQEATYSLWRDERDYQIDWLDSAFSIQRFIDAVSFPYQGACTLLNGKKVRILNALPLQDVVIENRSTSIGKVIFVEEGYPVVVCGTGLLKLTVMVEDEVSHHSVLPLRKFRSRFY
jgi:methionyl-tRNA formyltransferase